MYIAGLRIVLQIPKSHSLKDKRQVIRSLLTRARNEFSVASAEVGDQDRWQIAELGFSYVSNNAAHAEEVLEKVTQFIEATRPDIAIVDHQIETYEL